MQQPHHFDIGVIGGGPAGATAARWLAERGHRVALFCRSGGTSPPNAIWETLSPGALELLRFGHPDLWPRFKRSLVPCRATVLWLRSDSKSSSGRAAMLIDRRKLDPLLRQSAINAGATLLSSARVISRGEDFWVVATKNGDPIECHFLVNAAGRHSPLREGRAVHSPRTIALTAWVDGACLDDGESRVEAAAEAWLWAVRCGNANASVTVFVSLETAHRWQREDRKAEFLRCLRKTSLGASQTPLRLSSNIRAGDGTIAAQPCVFSNYLAHIGDAALALDPLASQGIHHALLSAQQAGIALNTTLVRGHAALAETFLSKRHDEALQQHLSACVALYQRQDTFHTPFWEERSKTIIRAPSALPAELPHGGGALFETSFVLCRNACWETLPVAVGDFIETRPALCHPRLPRAVAYLEDRPLSDLLADLPPRFTAATLLKRWIEKGLPTGAASRALVFLVRHQVLVARKRVPG